MIKVICFDLGKVIINFDYAQSPQELAKITPLPVTEVMRVLADDSLVLDYETGKISTADFYRLVSETLKLSASLEKFKQLWGSMFLPEPLLSESFLQALKKTYRLILLSNTNEIHFEFVREKYAILSHIEEHVLSYQVGWMKPHSQIYAAAESSLSLSKYKGTSSFLENLAHLDGFSRTLKIVSLAVYNIPNGYLANPYLASKHAS